MTHASLRVRGGGGQHGANSFLCSYEYNTTMMILTFFKIIHHSNDVLLENVLFITVTRLQMSLSG